MKNMQLRDLFIQKINALYDIENVLVKALPKMAKAASNEELKMGFTSHLEETQNHVKRLEQICQILDVAPKKLKAEGIRGIVADGEWVIDHIEPENALDASLARAAQYAEHYEMAGYMAAISWADMLEETEISNLLQETLAEEKAADEKLDMVGKQLDQSLL